MVAGVIVTKTARQIDRIFDYEIPDALRQEVCVGSRVTVPFGAGGRLCEGFVLCISDSPDGKVLKEIVRSSNDGRVFDEKGADLIRWLRDRTLCSYIDAAHLLIPAGTGIRFTEYVYTTDMDTAARSEILKAAPVKRRIAEEIEASGGGVSLDELALHFGHGVRGHINELRRMGVVAVEERAASQVGRRTVRFADIAVSDAAAAQAEKTLEKKAPKQARIINLLRLNGSTAAADLLKMAGAGASALAALEKKGIIKLYKQEAERSPIGSSELTAEEPRSLTKEQQVVFDTLAESMESGLSETFLLRGVTGSGKTEVYMHLIAHAILKGKTAIVLVPEISLTPLMTKRFVSRFGKRVAILHSALSLGERYDEWRRIKNGEVDVVVGARSAVFAPLDNIGVIILDEEHETTYKSEMSPRYHARDVAVFRASQYGAAVVLASATPLVESYYKACSGSYRLLEMERRVGAKGLPTVYVADMRQELENGNRSMFSDILSHELLYNIEHGEQSILFLNRRGFSTFISCRSCGYVAKCPHCDISLTYHRHTDRLVCHYCGYTHENYKVCPECGSLYIKYFGTGTQRLEQEIEKKFEGIKTVRMDFDTTSTKRAHEKLLDKFEKEKADVLIGTQMVSKGLDFHNVTLVGVVAADTSLYLDDYRSAERTFSLITQVCGRAGRGELEGRAIVQTYTPEHSAVVHAKNHDYKGFYRDEIKLRKALWYPPFCEIVSVMVTGKDESTAASKADRIARYIGSRLEAKIGQKTLLLGPAAAGVSKIKDKYRFCIIIKCECADGLNGILKDVLANAARGENRKLISVSVDKNPNSFV